MKVDIPNKNTSVQSSRITSAENYAATWWTHRKLSLHPIF